LLISFVFCIDEQGNVKYTEGKIHSKKCAYNQLQAMTCTSEYDVKLEQSISPTNSTTADSETIHDDFKLHDKQYHQHKSNHKHLQSLKLENNNIKYESCNAELQQRCNTIEKTATISIIEEEQQIDQQLEHITYPPSCRIKCESGYKCEMLRCEQCIQEAGQLAIMEMDQDSGILDDDGASSKLDTDAEVKEELKVLVIFTFLFSYCILVCILLLIL
jgi:hypothetical protein